MPKKSKDSLNIWQNCVSSCTGNWDGIPPSSLAKIGKKYDTILHVIMLTKILFSTEHNIYAIKGK